jgi:hypothetical protein
LAKLRRAPEARVGELELGVRRALVLSLVATIKVINEQIKQLERQIATANPSIPTARSSCRCSRRRRA